MTAKSTRVVAVRSPLSAIGFQRLARTPNPTVRRAADSGKRKAESVQPSCVPSFPPSDLGRESLR